MERKNQRTMIGSRYQDRKSILVGVMLFLFLVCIRAFAADEKKDVKIDPSLSNLKISVLAYFDYSSGEMPLPDDKVTKYSQFALTRGYLTVYKGITDWLGARTTVDIFQETKAAGTNTQGNYVVRLKYLYAELKPKDLAIFTNMKSEVGMGHNPWLDFEESIDPFRCQGTMPIERAGVFASADLGVSLMGNLGGKVDDAAGKIGNTAYDGKYGSWHLGVYNGSGYNGIEANENRAFEGRISIRPLPGQLPGLQFSYFGLTGEGNQTKVKGNKVSGIDLKDVPYFGVNMGMVSFDHPYVTLIYEYFAAEGNAKGDWIRPKNGVALRTAGWSVFADGKIPAGDNGKVHIFARYDEFDRDVQHKWADNTRYYLTIAGLGFDVYKSNMIILVFENTDYQKDCDVKGKIPKKGNDLGDEQKWQVVWQTKY